MSNSNVVDLSAARLRQLRRDVEPISEEFEHAVRDEQAELERVAQANQQKKKRQEAERLRQQQELARRVRKGMYFDGRH